MEILRVSEVGVDATAAKAAAIVAQGGLIVYPTDTLYGIGVNALDAGAVRRLRALKAREENKPISIMVPSIAAIDWHAVLTPAARRLAEKFLPGALTLVVPARTHVPRDVAHEGMLGVRIPADGLSHALSAMSEFPITATSANLAGYKTPASVQDLILHFGPSIKDIDLFIDDGPRSGGAPSTVVAFLENDVPVILREGALSRETLGI